MLLMLLQHIFEQFKAYFLQELEPQLDSELEPVKKITGAGTGQKRTSSAKIHQHGAGTVLHEKMLTIENDKRLRSVGIIFNFKSKSASKVFESSTLLLFLDSKFLFLNYFPISVFDRLRVFFSPAPTPAPSPAPIKSRFSII